MKLDWMLHLPVDTIKVKQLNFMFVLFNKWLWASRWQLRIWGLRIIRSWKIFVVRLYTFCSCVPLRGLMRKDISLVASAAVVKNSSFDYFCLESSFTSTWTNFTLKLEGSLLLRIYLRSWNDSDFSVLAFGGVHPNSRPKHLVLFDWVEGFYLKPKQGWFKLKTNGKGLQLQCFTLFKPGWLVE